MHLADNIALNQGLIGGILLGSSASAFLFLTGKITGISGICENIVNPDGDDWNISYIAGLGVAGMILKNVQGSEAMFGVASDFSVPVIITAGLITGFGTRLAKGCTSGHGLCGLARRSPRSLTAVLTFMATGGMMATVTRMPSIHSLLTSASIFDNLKNVTLENPSMFLAPTVAVLGFSFLKNMLSGSGKAKSSSNWSMHLISFGSALLFGLGLGFSGMCSTERVLRFLDFSGAAGWDPTLAAVLGGGVCVTGLIFPFLHSTDCKSFCTSASLKNTIKMGMCPENTKIDWQLIVGSALFGMGWGLFGACPGPALVSFGAGISAASVFVPSMMIGMMVQDALKL